MAKKMITENDVKKYLKSALDAIPNCYHFAASAGGFSMGGISDRLGLVRGRFFAIEAKRPGRRGEANEGLSALQKQFGQRVEDAGGDFFKVDDQESVDAVRWILERL